MDARADQGHLDLGSGQNHVIIFDFTDISASDCTVVLVVGASCVYSELWIG